MEKDNNTQSYIALTKGTMVSHYRIINKIGAGGMGEVYLAEDTKLDRRVALKFLPPHLCQDEDCRTRFKREAQAAAKLDHPNIVTIYEVSEYQGRPFFAMQLVEGQSLRDHAKARELEIDRVVNLAIQICDGLNAAHEKKVIHRDIKPSNIVIDAYGRPKILDFGLAAIQGGEHLTKTGSTLGTVRYMSPEQVRGKEVDHRSDLFSLGVVLYELITSQSPFSRDNDMATGQAIVNDMPDPLAKYRANVPEPLQAIVTKLLEKDPNLRYQSAAGVIPDLRQLRRRSDSDTAAHMPIRTRRWGLISAVAAAICVIAVVAGYFLIGDRSTQDDAGSVQEVSARWANSIAVLPFRDFSPDQDQEYFCDGMTDALIGRLSGIKSLKVISMTSVMRYKSPDRDLRKIGQDLRVNTILEGTIQKEGDQIRVRAQLIKVADDAHLWSQTYNRELSSVFAIQDDISRAIVDAMKIELLGVDTTIISRRYTENVEAYNYYSRGRHLWAKQTERDIRKAIEHYEKAIELDPNYALAYSGLADAWIVLPRYTEVPGAVDRTEANARAKQAAEMALALDPYLAEAHTSMAMVLRYDSDFERAEREYLRAIELNPGYFWAHYWYSLCLDDMARYQEQIREEDIAFALDPTSIVLTNNKANRKWAALEWEEAEELYKRLIEIEPNRYLSYLSYAGMLSQVGRYDEAIRQCSLAVRINPAAYNHLAYNIYDRKGDFEKALWAADMAIELDPATHNAYDTKAWVFSKYGVLDSAVVYYKKALEVKPDFALSLQGLGNAHMFRREYARAESCYRELASHSDRAQRAAGRLGLAGIPLHQGKFSKGLDLLAELRSAAIADSVKNNYLAMGVLKRGWIYLHMLDEPQSAIAEFEEVIEIMNEILPNSWLVVVSQGMIAVCHARRGDMATADRLMHELEVDLDRYGPFALVNYWWGAGELEMEKGNFDSASTCFEKVIQRWYNSMELEMLAQCYLGAGRLDEAISVFEKIINRYDINRAYWPAVGVLAHFHLGQAYEAAGRHEDAISQYETFLDIWKNADEGVPSIDDARARLARLRDGS